MSHEAQSSGMDESSITAWSDMRERCGAGWPSMDEAGGMDDAKGAQPNANARSNRTLRSAGRHLILGQI